MSHPPLPVPIPGWPRATTTAVACLLIASALLLMAAPTPLAAQQPEPGTMVIELGDPEEIFDEHDREHFGDWLIAVFAGEELCAVVDYPANDPASAVLGAPGQQDACGSPGAPVQFVNGLGHLLFFETEVVPGTTLELENWAPHPPHTAYPDFVCTFLAGQGLDVAACQVVGAPGASGTVLWAFAPKLPFVDQRVTTAFVLLMDTEAAAAAWAHATIALQYADENVIADAPPEDAEPLLMAAGLLPPDGGALGVDEARPCAIWVPAGAANEPMLRALGEALGQELVRVLGTFGVDARPCQVTNDESAADLLIWEAGQEPEVLGHFDPGAAGFLAFAPPPGAVPGAGSGGGVPAPARGGHGPSSITTPDGALTWPVVMAALVLASLLAARVATGRSRR